MKVKDAKRITGGGVTTRNSKMPGTSYGLSTDSCGAGGRLRGVEGSVCQKCYARRIEKRRPNVAFGYQRRTESVLKAMESQEGMDNWVHAMIFLIHRSNTHWHRWHDSGDLQSELHLDMIVRIANELPFVNFWLPTKEVSIVKSWLKKNDVPDNLNTRLCGYMVDDGISQRGTIPITVSQEITGSTVIDVGVAPKVGCFVCPAPSQNNNCEECRACWDRQIKTVSYKRH